MNEAECCCICCDNWTDDRSKIVVKCRHEFHTDCYNQLLTSSAANHRKTLCPLCRVVLADAPAPVAAPMYPHIAADSPHDILVRSMPLSISSGSGVRLNFNHPIGELLWRVPPDQSVDYVGFVPHPGEQFVTHGSDWNAVRIEQSLGRAIRINSPQMPPQLPGTGSTSLARYLHSHGQAHPATMTRHQRTHQRQQMFQRSSRH